MEEKKSDKKDEKAIELEILSFNRKILRVDRAVDYHDFVTEKEK